jgi:hypothetical protein
MFKPITYVSTVLLITSVFTSMGKSQTAFAQTMGTGASSLSTLSLPVVGQPTTTQQASTSSTLPNGQILTNTITTTTVLDSSGKPVTKIIESTSTSPLAIPGVMLPMISPVQITLPNITN